MSIKAIESLAKNMRREYENWLYIREHGCSDPFWPDGANMNLIRNHIIYDKQQIEDLIISEDLLFEPIPSVVPTPPEVNKNFMAKPRSCLSLVGNGSRGRR